MKQKSAVRLDSPGRKDSDDREDAGMPGRRDHRGTDRNREVFFFKQKTAYEMLSGDWSSDVCSSDLRLAAEQLRRRVEHPDHDVRHALNVDALADRVDPRSEERRVGKECRLTCRS